MAPVHADFRRNRDFWCTPDGHQRVLDAVRPRVPYTPAEWQIRLPAAMLAGSDVLLILRTGGGKTSLVSHAVFADPDGITLLISPLNLMKSHRHYSRHAHPGGISGTRLVRGATKWSSHHPKCSKARPSPRSSTTRSFAACSRASSWTRLMLFSSGVTLFALLMLSFRTCASGCPSTYPLLR